MLKLEVLLQEMISGKRQLQLQLHDSRAALITSRSTANSAGTFAAQAVAGRQRYKAALCEMRACVEEMYTEGELAFERILNKKEKLTEELQQERASRRQEVQTLMDQIYSLTAQLALSQVRAIDSHSVGYCYIAGWQPCTAICKH